MMLEELGTLPMGVERDGRRCREFMLRPLKMRDSVEARASKDAARLAENDELMGLYLLGRRLAIEGVPEAAIDLDFMLDLWDEDMQEIMDAEGRLAEQVARFRGAGTEEADPGVDESGLRLPGGGGAAGAGETGVAGGLAGAEDAGPVRPGEEVQNQTAE